MSDRPDPARPLPVPAPRRGALPCAVAVVVVLAAPVLVLVATRYPGEVAATTWCRLRATLGDGRAAYELSSRLENGNGVRPEFVAGERWLQVAARAGDADAMASLGVRLVVRGRDLKDDAALAEGVRWVVAGQGASASPQASIAELGCDELVDRAAGDGGVLLQAFSADVHDVLSDTPAVLELRRRAQAGSTEAMAAYAQCAQAGFGMHEDPAIAVAWYRKAGDRDARRRLALLLKDHPDLRQPGDP